MIVYFSLDRRIGDKAVLIDEAKQPLEVPAAMLPPGCKNGDMLVYADGRFAYAKEKTDEKRKIMAETLALLLKRGNDEKDG